MKPVGSVWQFLAPAKVNLALRVVGQRADGYHLLESIFVFFPLYDHLEITLMADGVELVCEPEVTACPEENLVYRAALALLAETGLARGVRLRLRKGIPAGAGLGGGSSDAALTMLALNRLWGCKLGSERLLELGVALGADLPFFLGGRSALVQGIGERLTPLTDFPGVELVLIYPGVSLSTARVFRALAGRFSVERKPWVLPSRDVVSLLENDLESPAKALEPVIGEAVMALRQAGAMETLMSGSGSSVYGLFPDAQASALVVEGLVAKHPEWQIFSGAIFHTHPFFQSGLDNVDSLSLQNKGCL